MKSADFVQAEWCGLGSILVLALSCRVIRMTQNTNPHSKFENVPRLLATCTYSNQKTNSRPPRSHQMADYETPRSETEFARDHKTDARTCGGQSISSKPPSVYILHTDTIYFWFFSSSHPFTFPHVSICPIFSLVCVVFNVIPLPCFP